MVFKMWKVTFAWSRVDVEPCLVVAVDKEVAHWLILRWPCPCIADAEDSVCGMSPVSSNLYFGSKSSSLSAPNFLPIQAYNAFLLFHGCTIFVVLCLSVWHPLFASDKRCTSCEEIWKGQFGIFMELLNLNAYFGLFLVQRFCINIWIIFYKFLENMVITVVWCSILFLANYSGSHDP